MGAVPTAPRGLNTISSHGAGPLEGTGHVVGTRQDDGLAVRRAEAARRAAAPSVDRRTRRQARRDPWREGVPPQYRRERWPSTRSGCLARTSCRSCTTCPYQPLYHASASTLGLSSIESIRTAWR